MNYKIDKKGSPLYNTFEGNKGGHIIAWNDESPVSA